MRNFTHALLLTNSEIANIHKSFLNNSSANVILSKTQICKIIQSGQFLDKILGPLIKVDLSLIKNVVKPLAENVWIPLKLTAAAADAGIQKTSDLELLH